MDICDVMETGRDVLIADNHPVGLSLLGPNLMIISGQSAVPLQRKYNGMSVSCQHNKH